MADKFGNVVSSRIPIFDSEDEVDKFAGKCNDNKPEAFLVYLGTTERLDENNIDRVNSVIDCVLLLYYRVAFADVDAAGIVYYPRLLH